MTGSLGKTICQRSYLSRSRAAVTAAASFSSIRWASARISDDSVAWDDDRSGAVGKDPVAREYADSVDLDRDVRGERGNVVTRGADGLPTAVCDQFEFGDLFQVAEPPVGQDPGESGGLDPGDLLPAGQGLVGVAAGAQHQHVAGAGDGLEQLLEPVVGAVMVAPVGEEADRRDLTEQHLTGRRGDEVQDVGPVVEAPAHRVANRGGREPLDVMFCLCAHAFLHPLGRRILPGRVKGGYPEQAPS